MTGLPLTPRQREVLAFVNTFLRDQGFGPSLQQIGSGLGLTSVATVHKHLTALATKGYILRPKYRARSVRVLIDERACPTCLRPFEAQS